MTPWLHPSFVIFFLVAIAGIGPTGLWIELHKYIFYGQANGEAFRAAYVSFLPAFGAATTLQLIWAEQKRSLRAAGILCIAICGLLLLFSQSPALKEGFALTLGAIATLLALSMWWIANANQPEFKDEPGELDLNPMGGPDTGSPLAGSLADFQTE
jgi:hypothetical protein